MKRNFREEGMKRVRVRLACWLLVVAGVVLSASAVLAQNSGSGDTLIWTLPLVLADWATCRNTPSYICCDCNFTERPFDCLDDEEEDECDDASPAGVTLGYGESFAFIDDDGPNASPVGSGCASCGPSGAGIPEASQLPRLRLRRIWHSIFSQGSFGNGMYLTYDYSVRRFVFEGRTYIWFTDPNIVGSASGSAEGFLEEGGVYIPGPWPGRADYHTKIVEATATHITFEELGGRKLRFEWTGYLEFGAYGSARLEYIEDRNGNRINFIYLHPATNTTPDVFMWRTATDAYGRSFAFRYLAWQGINVIDEVTLPDGRKVRYLYDASINPHFVHEVDYGDRIKSSLTYNTSTETSTHNEALLSPDHHRQAIQLSSFCQGRVRSIKRADGTFQYARRDVEEGNIFITTVYDRGESFEIKSSTTKAIISKRQRRVDGTWEELTRYQSDDNRPVKGITKPPDLTTPERTWSGEREGDTDRISGRTYPDRSSESFTFNLFAQMTSHTHRSRAIETWEYDAKGNLLSHTEAAGAPEEATESWSYNDRGQVLTHTDFNGNVTSYGYHSNGEMHTIALPASDGQPAGTITYTYDNAGRVKTITDPANRTVRFDHDAAGRLIKTTYGDGSFEETTYGTGEFSARILSTKDRNANCTLFTYDATGRILTTQVREASCSGPVLSTTTNTWDANTGRLMAMNRDGDSTEYSYDYKGRVLTTTVHPKAGQSLVTTNEYDQYHLLSTTDPYGRKTSYTYDELDRLLTTSVELTPGGEKITTRNEYDAQGRLIAFIDGKGVRYEYDYDERDRRTRELCAVGKLPPELAEESYEYDGNSNLLKMTDKNGQVWEKTYTARNKVRFDANPLDQRSVYTYYPDGLLETMTNPNSHTTRYVYDNCCGGVSGGRLIEIIDADQNSIKYMYDPNGNRTKVTDESGRVVAYQYDGLNRQTKMIVDPDGLKLETKTDYDPTPNTIGRKETLTSPARQVVVTNYDGVGRVESITEDTPHLRYTYDVMADGAPCVPGLLLKTTITDANGNSRSSLTDGAGRTVKTIDGLNNVTCLAYDNNSNLLVVVDRDGKRTRYDYDARNRRTTMVADEGGIDEATTQYKYDRIGNLLEITDATGKITCYAYDSAHRRGAATYACGTDEARTWRYQYHPMGQLKQVTKPNDVVIVYGYDNLERLASRQYSTGGSDTFTYHANGLLKRAVGGLYNTIIDRSNLELDYDRANRLLRERQEIGAGPKTVAYTYYPDSLVDQITYPTGTRVQHTYTPRRELFEVKIGGVVQASHTYDPGGRRRSRTYANGKTTNWTYDAEDRIITLNNGNVQAWDYRYTAEGDPLVQDDRTTANRGEAYAYDGMHRLIDHKQGQVVGNTVPTPNFQQGWTLDKVGNWTAWNNNGTNETRTHNNHHALTRRGTVPVPQNYDLNFNQTDDGSRFKFVYDAEDRLKQVKDRNTEAVLVQYRYDAFGRRVEKEFITGPPSILVRYYYSDERIIEERNGIDAVTASYTYGDYIDEPLTMDRGDNRYYYHSNRIFSVYGLTNAAGQIVERYSYTPYGEVMSFDAAYQSPLRTSRVGNPFTYTGRELDAETGLMHYRARTYDTVQGRFKQRDPSEYVNGMNLYEYVRSTPTMMTDPSGLQILVQPMGPTAQIIFETTSSPKRRCDPDESTEDKHKKWIEVLSFSWGVDQPATVSASSHGSLSAERANFHPFTVVKALDKASPKLYVATASGEHYPSAILEICRAGGDKQPYMEYKMTDVMVSSVRPGGNGGDDDIPLEEVSFSYGKIEWKCTQTKVEGGKGSGNVAAGWDLKTNKKF